MGAPGSVFEAISRHCPQPRPSDWPISTNSQHNAVLYTRRAFGLDWRYSIDCVLSGHHLLHVTPDQSARLRDPTVITIPNGTWVSVQEAIDSFFGSGSATDLSIPGYSLCPYCAESVHESLCNWTLLPWTIVNAPARLFFRFPGRTSGSIQLPPPPSPTLLMGVDYCLAGVSYHISASVGADKNHFVTQFRSRGRWFKYDCLNGGRTTVSDDFDPSWHTGSQHMLVYLRTTLFIATPTAYPSSPGHPGSTSGQPCPDSPSGRTGDMDIIPELPGSPSGRTDLIPILPDSPSGRTDHIPEHPVSPSGRTDPMDYDLCFPDSPSGRSDPTVFAD